MYSVLKLPNEIDLEYMNVCGAPFAGPIAIIRDHKQFVPIKGTAKPVIRIINATGLLISTIHVT